MSAIDDVLEEIWRLDDDGLSAYVSVEGQRYDERVFQCDHSIVKDKLERTQARAAVASKAPKWGQALEEVEAVADAALEWYRDEPEKYEKALRTIRAVAKKALAAVREAAGD